MDTTTKIIDCACVIHSSAYEWNYVEKLYNMLTRNLTPQVRLHVYTEPDRPVPPHMVKHALEDWGISGSKRSWWYKLQLFNPANHAGNLLYFDLDTVIVKNIDWIWQLPVDYFWTVRDFKYLWRPSSYNMNSSIMWWDTQKFETVWQQFKSAGIDAVLKKHRGDQDFLNLAISDAYRRYFDANTVKSWRWQCKDGGYNFATRTYNLPDSGTVLDNNTSVLVFHGKPKPTEIKDPLILQHWQ